MRPYHLAVLALALTAPVNHSWACVGTPTEMTFEGEPNGDEPFKLHTPASPGEPARTWVDDDGLPTLMSILQSVENKSDVSAYSDLFKKSLERLVNKTESYLKQDNVDDDTKDFYKGVAEGAKKFLGSMKAKPLDKKLVAAFYKEMGDPLKAAIENGVYGYEVLDPATGKPEDADEPFTVVGQFGPAVKFWDKIEGNVPKGMGCGGYTMKMKPAKKSKNADGGTYMVNPGE